MFVFILNCLKDFQSLHLKKQVALAADYFTDILNNVSDSVSHSLGFFMCLCINNVDFFSDRFCEYWRSTKAQ